MPPDSSPQKQLSATRNGQASQDGQLPPPKRAADHQPGAGSSSRTGALRGSPRACVMCVQTGLDDVGRCRVTRPLALGASPGLHFPFSAQYILVSTYPPTYSHSSLPHAPAPAARHCATCIPVRPGPPAASSRCTTPGCQQLSLAGGAGLGRTRRPQTGRLGSG